MLRLETRYEPKTGLVHGVESFEELGKPGPDPVSIRLPLTFALFEADDFEALASSCGLDVAALHGDYKGETYRAGESPQMVFFLSKRAGA
jgi:hypothetical protein